MGGPTYAHALDDHTIAWPAMSMLSSLNTLVEGLVEQWGYLGIFGAMVLENLIPPIPSELIMPLAGFYVARGRATGPKQETTIALSPLAAAGAHGHELLGAEWLHKWQRSDAKAPFGVADADDTWGAAVTGHPQFRTS